MERHYKEMYVSLTICMQCSKPSKLESQGNPIQTDEYLLRNYKMLMMKINIKNLAWHYAFELLWVPEEVDLYFGLKMRIFVSYRRRKRVHQV
ncbi:hypothetical protein QVD17_01049 [Tagetes erecta]|uniref:Uncharacterized protein n=1 Tax=Tagetes erecta TaxID=13708 RepID=A0AAD8P6F5_TARER|nr:hypothetical protein QVD17_01049 [Tagetes erecta]